MFVKGGIALALAAAFGVNAPVVNAASIAPDPKPRLQKSHLMAKMVKLNTKLKALIQQVNMS